MRGGVFDAPDFDDVDMGLKLRLRSPSFRNDSIICIISLRPPELSITLLAMDMETFSFELALRSLLMRRWRITMHT